MIAAEAAGIPCDLVVAHGAGVSISRRSQPAAIARAVERVLREPRFTRAAQALGAGIRREAASGRLLAELESD